MADQSLGNLILRLLVDNKAFKESLVASLQMVQLASQQIKDLTNFKISAPDMQALDLALQTGEARVRDFIAAESAIPNLGPSVDGALDGTGKKHKEHSEKVETGARAVRKFYSEQRLQDRVVGDSKNALVALTGSFLPFIAGSNASGGASRKLADGLSVGIEQASSMEFALFGLSQVGGKVPGVLGGVIGGVAGLAGPISLAVGAGAMLITMMKDTNEEAQKVSEEGLKDFQTRLEKLSGIQRVRLTLEITSGLAAADAELAKLREKGERTILTPVEFGRIEELKNIIPTLKAIATKGGEVNDAIAKQAEAEKLTKKGFEDTLSPIQEQDAAIAKLNDEIERRVDAVSGLPLTEEQLRLKVDQVNAALGNRNEMLRSSVELAKDAVTVAELQYQMGRGSVDQVREVFAAQIALLKTPKERLEAEQKLRAFNQQVAADDVAVAETKKKLGLATTEDVIRALEAQRATFSMTKDQLAIDEKILAVKTEEANRQAEIAKQNVATAEAALDSLEKRTKDANLNSIQNPFEKQLATERRRHEEAIRNIDAEAQRIIDAGGDASSAEAARTAEERQSRINELNIRRSAEAAFRQEVSQLTQIAIANEFDARRLAEQTRFEEEQRTIAQKYAGTREGDKLAFENEAAHQRALAQLEKDRVQAVTDLKRIANSESFENELRDINARFDEAERTNQQLYVAELARISGRGRAELEEALKVGGAELQLQEILAAGDQQKLAQLATARAQYEQLAQSLGLGRVRAVGNAELANVQKVLGAAQSIVGNIASAARAIEEPAEGFLANFEKALLVAQAIVAVITTLKAIGSFFSPGLKSGGVIPATYAANGIEVPGGSFVVKKSESDKNRPLLEALGGQRVTGGTPGKDSVPVVTESGAMIMVMPDEYIVPPYYSPIAKAINDGAQLVRRAGGGSFEVGLQRSNPMAGVIEAVQEYYDAGLRPGTFPISRNIVEQIQLQINGGLNKETFDALIDEVRVLNKKVDTMSSAIRSQTSSIDSIQLKLPEEIELKAVGRDLRAVIRRDEFLDQ